MTDSFLLKLKNGCLPFGLDIDEAKAQKFYRYMELLVEWNEKINLTAITDEDGVVYKHFVDSLTIYPHLRDLAKKIPGADGDNKIHLIDVGTGAGFPGIPLAIFDENIEVVLLDSLAKRVNFLQTVINELGLTNIVAVHSRAEDGAQDSLYREQFDFAVARAVAAMPLLSEYCVPFVKVGGYFVAMKGGDVADEAKEAQKALKILGCSTSEIKTMSIEEISSERSLVCSKKISKTDKKYPRKAGIPSKKPLK